ncbi:MAG: DUF2071 domain-containing protein [Gemmatimonadaceae bacterium]|nr:DUF2071 domain-containing protein [Chitinophagaceae bacterium]
MSDRNFLSAKWENLIMANYEVSPDILEPYLPHGVEIDFHNGKTYVSLVGFMFRNTRIFNIAIPFLGTFEEINLRFYVKRTEGENIKRGVVFINESVPFKVVAWIANKLYKENYIALPTKNFYGHANGIQTIKYEWKINNAWNHIAVDANAKTEAMQPGSMEEFIFEHYYGYTKISENVSSEYKVDHPRWLINKVRDYVVDCDFNGMYGERFAFLKGEKPDSVFLAEGSPVTVKWKRSKF